MRYTKMHGAGNAFLLLENLHAELRGEDLSVLARRLCDPKTGPGADGMILILPAEQADAAMLFYNADGSLGEMCGNGARCLARYCVERGLASNPARIRLETTAGLVIGQQISREQYRIRLNDPRMLQHRQAHIGTACVPCVYVELGEPGLPHAVVETDAAAFSDPDALREQGRALRHSGSFPRGANVDFFCFLGQDRVRAVTFERGVEDFTLACGTGCGAIAAALTLEGRLHSDTLSIEMPGGTLSVTVHREGDLIRDLLLTGPTAVVETGEVSL